MAVSSAKLFAALLENPALVAAIRDAQENEESGELDMSAVAETLQKGRQTEILEKKTDGASAETIEEMRARMVAVALDVSDLIVPSGTSGKSRVTLPFGSGSMTFEYTRES